MRTYSSEDSILDALANAENRMLRFGDLVKSVQISRTTVSKELKRLQKEKKVERILDSTSQVYPPPVYYKTLEPEKIVQKRILTAQLWANELHKKEEAMASFFETLANLSPLYAKMLTTLIRLGVRNAPLQEIPRALEKIIREAETKTQDD